MAITLPHDLEEQLRQIAAREHRSPEAVLRTLLSQYPSEVTQKVDYRPEAVRQRTLCPRPAVLAAHRGYSTIGLD